MQLWICVHLPRLALEVFQPRWSPERAAAVLEHGAVLLCSGMAASAGVRQGMRASGVRLLAPETALFAREAKREQEALDGLALAALRFSPQAAHAGDGSLLIDAGASLTLFGGPRALCAALRRDIAAMGYTVIVASAPTARGAWLLARHARPPLRVLLPAALLPPALPYLDWLEGIACARLGKLRRLPRPALLRRCGMPLLAMLDHAYGAHAEMFEWIVTPPQFHARLELFDRVEHSPALLAGAQHLLLQMTGWLCARQLAVGRIALTLEYERGRSARAPLVLEVVLAQAVWRDEHLVRLLRERLALLRLDAPVIAMTLRACDVEALAPPSASLFPEPGGTATDRARLLELLAARLGEENILQPAPRADYRPESANVWLPLGCKTRQPAPAATAERPAWLLATPQPLRMRQDRPYYRTPLRIVSAPERIEAGWWNDGCARDYFIAQGEDHALYWIYRERGGEQTARWYLHGLFG
jgi:protein ImuB